MVWNFQRALNDYLLQSKGKKASWGISRYFSFDDGLAMLSNKIGV